MSAIGHLADIDGDKVTFEPQSWGGFKIATNHCDRAFKNDQGPTVALAVLESSGWGTSTESEYLRMRVQGIANRTAAGQIKTLPDCIVPAATFMAAADLGLDRVVGTSTIKYPNPNAVSTLEYVHAVLADVTLGDDETVVDANVVDPDAVAAKALESLNDAWGGDEPYPAPILKAILALEEHAETLMADAEQAELEREALDLRSIVFGNTATEWADLTREAKAKWIAVALRAREFRSKDAQ